MNDPTNKGPAPVPVAAPGPALTVTPATPTATPAPLPAPTPAATPAPASGAPATGAPQKRSLLDDVAILRPLSPMLKSQLEAQLTPRILKAGEILFHQGDVGDAMYVIVDGIVSVFVTDKALGLTMDLATLGRGEAFGEMALVTGERRSATVKAVEDNTKVLGLSRDVFYRLVQAVPQVGLTIASTLARRLEQVNKTQGVAFGSLKGTDFDPALRDLIPASVIHKHRVVPVSHQGNIVTIATPDPNNRLAVDDIKRILRGTDVKLMAVSEDDFDKYIARHYPRIASPTKASQAATKDYSQLANAVRFHGSVDREGTADRAAAQQPDVVDLVSKIVVEGIDRFASDIHIEPDREHLKVRYRVDGRLEYRAGKIPMSVHAAIISRIKVLASLDIAERRLPQDGRLSLSLRERQYDLRLSTIHTKYGEKATMRILDASSLEADIGSLILAEKVSQVIRRLFYRPNGLVLVTGPTGSGKTTTLYAALLERRNPELNICTIEDPIEYNIDDITQVQVQEGIGLGFPDIMRSFLRQDPDIILVGETRDSETARLACNAALTGHLVLSSFHTNDAISAVQRLRSMDIESFSIADALLGVVNQRLVRRLCPACSEVTHPNELIRQNLERSGVRLNPNVKFYRGKGCATCGGDGFKGRMGVYELLVVSQPVREAIARGADAAELKAAASDGSWVPLSRYASFLLNEGLTVPSEILRILPKD